MNEENKHINEDFKTNSFRFFSKLEVPYERSKEEVWEQLAEQLEEKPESPKIIWFNPKVITAIAASLLVLFSILSVMRFYAKAVYSPGGQHLTALLPDGSTVDLNADTKLTYHPYWWRFSRTVGFEGEGFFNVEKGKKFEVVSNTGRTVVLGTSFNIYNRDKAYKVTCVTGKVKVISTTKQEVILSPDYHAEVDEKGNIRVYKEYETELATSWVNNMFTFTSVSLSDVIKEIERQYNVNITFDTSKDYFYTGFFSRDKQVEEVLDLLTTTFGFTFVKRSNSEYEIIQTVSE